MARAGRRLALILLAAALNGCALLAPQPAEPDTAAWEQRRSSYEKISHWTVSARMATALLGWSGSLDWQQSGPYLQINVSGPLGIGGFRANGDLDSVKVVTSDGQKLQGDPEILYQQVVGWHFPLRGMRYWALGLPVPGQPVNLQLDAQGRVVEMQQNGWLVRYTEYRQYGDQVLPRRMKLEQGDLTVRIVIDDWQHIERV